MFGKLVEPLDSESQILGVVPDVQRDERGFRMAREDAIAGFQAVRDGSGKPGPLKRPVGMIGELLVALVEPIDRQEERFRVGDVDGDRQAECAARFPHRIEAGIVHFDERT